MVSIEIIDENGATKKKPRPYLERFERLNRSSSMTSSINRGDRFAMLKTAMLKTAMHFYHLITNRKSNSNVTTEIHRQILVGNKIFNSLFQRLLDY